MTYRVVHRTTHEYSQPVTVSHHVARLKPRASAVQQVHSCSLLIDPEPAVRQSRPDYFGNEACFFSIQEAHSRLEVTAESVVEVQGQPPGLPAASPPWEEVAALFRDPVSPDVIDPYQFVFDSPTVHAAAELHAYARPSFPARSPLLVATAHLCQRIHQEFQFDPVATTVTTPLAEVMQNRRGVCQDFAHLAIGCLRSMGLAARYVSGYLRTRPPAGKPRLVGADASHAWVAVYCPGRGWVDFDPTNDVQPWNEHITLACGRDYSDVSPLAGILTGGGDHEVKVAVDVEPL